MNGLRFETASPPLRPDPNRVDVACFVGHVARRASALPATVRDALSVQGWVAGPWRRPAIEVESLLQLPVVVESWAAFDALFAWDARPVSAGSRRRCAAYLGAAVRSFFEHGGRRAVIVRTGDPWPVLEASGERAAQREDRLDALLALDANAADPSSWRGIGHLFGLPEVALVCLPDLADLCAADVATVDVEVEPPSSPEVFVECSTESGAAVEEDVGLRDLAPPRCDGAGFVAWMEAVDAVGARVAAVHREMLLIAALPLPQVDVRDESVAGAVWAQADYGAYLERVGILQEAGDADPRGRPRSAFSQLAWPWLKTRHGADLPALLEPPDGLLVGLLARNALSRGTFRSVAGTRLVAVYGSEPVLSWSGVAETPSDRLARRVCVVAPSTEGWALQSDVTPCDDEAWRAGGVSRLIGAVLRAARRVGESALFEASGPALWARVRRSMEHTLTAFWREGGLGGASAAEAFSVRCDRSTMSQNDLDSGRLRVEVSVLPVAAVERITVVLELTGGGIAQAAQEVA
jgi:hypothetical protein